MKVSIIVPVYNAEKFLPRCLDSLVNQTLDDYEVILINDGSKDSSAEIIESYREKYPEIIKAVTVENGGQGRARNIGIKMAKGKYLGFADSDDWVSPNMFKRLYEKAEAENADLTVCDITECHDDGSSRVIKMSQYEPLIKIDTAVWDKLIRRELAEGIYFPEGKVWYEDLDFVIRIALKSKKQARLSESLYFYRVGQESTMNNNNSAKNLDIIKIMEGLKAFMLPQGYEEEFKSLVLNHVLLETVKRVEKQNSCDKKSVIKQLREYVHLNIPELGKCESYKAETRNRRIIMYLNYHGLSGLSGRILKLKNKIS